jgi:protein phosphatase
LNGQEGFESVTRDHSLVEAQVQAGLIDREQSLKSEHQNILLRALGREPDVRVELNEITLAAGDRLLLCTDGLTRVVNDAQLEKVLQRFRGDPQGACDHLVAAANDGGGPDNITAVMIDVVGSRLSDMFERFTR